MSSGRKGLRQVSARALSIGGCLAGGLLAGCASQHYERAVAVEPTVMAQFLADKPPATQRLYRRVLEEGDRNAGLNHMRAGLAAMELGERETAAASFDFALDRIEAVYADNDAAEKARSLWFKESIKDFKGEGYERAMAYYYRGLLYLMAEDYENARASFKAGQLQDTFNEEERYKADFASLAYLEGWASHCLKQEGAAAEAFAEAKRLKPALVAPGPDDNLLAIVEYGTAPRKMPFGQHREALVYQDPLQPRLFNAGKTAVGARIDLTKSTQAQPQTLSPVVAEDLMFQARTRGGSQVDQILEGKAQFKQGTETAGKAVAAAGAATLYAGLYSRNENMAYAGGAALLVGLLVQAAADSMRPEADIRQWDNLPASIALGTLHLVHEGAEAPSAEVHYVSAGGEDVVTPHTGQMAGGKACWILWDRSHSALRVLDSAPGAVAR